MVDQNGAPLRTGIRARLTKVKYALVRMIDASGLTFLTPVVRLCFGEEPGVQLGLILRYIVVPILAIVAFLLLWSWIAPHHKTKSGEVPTPRVVGKAAENIWTFHNREAAKKTAYNLAGEDRLRALSAVERRLGKVQRAENKVKEIVERARTEAEAITAEEVAPVQNRYNALEAKLQETLSGYEQQMRQQAESFKSGDPQQQVELIAAAHKYIEDEENFNEQLQELRQQADEIRSMKRPGLVAALDMQRQVAEERQYLTKLVELLTRANREVRINNTEANLQQLVSEMPAGDNGEDVYGQAMKIARIEDRLETMRTTTYADPWTLPWQVMRSVCCVFCGFLLGTMIAVPIGIFCGLSPTFMAAVTPFIALFKPVSPIVWLPIALIIVGGFIPDPDKHWLIVWLQDAPLIGWLKIKPAFIACAITVALCSLWATMVNTAFGVASIEKDHLNVASVLRLGFKDRLFKIIIPSALPFTFAGMRISLGVGWMVLIAAELLSSSEGIGKFVWDQFSNGASDSFAKMFVVVFVVGFVGLLLDRIMIVLQRLVSFDGAPTAL